jgi:hypothetical protein
MKVKLTYYDSAGFWLKDVEAEPKLETVSQIRKWLKVMRESGSLPELPGKSFVIVWFEVSTEKLSVSGVIPLDGGGSVVYGDQASGNIAITGTVRGDVIGGDLHEDDDGDVVIRRRRRF